MSKARNDAFSDVASRVIRSIELKEKNIEEKVKPKMQNAVFFTSAVSFAVMNLASHGLAMVKPGYEVIGESLTGFDHIAKLDFSLMISIVLMPVFMIISGYLNDRFSTKTLLSYSLVSMWIIQFSIWIFEMLKISSVAIFTILITISNIIPMIGWPAYISLIGNWFSIKKRGVTFSLWMSWVNLWNLLSYILMNFLVHTFEISSIKLFALYSMAFGVLAMASSHLLIENPVDMNIVIDRFEQDTNTKTFTNLSSKNYQISDGGRISTYWWKYDEESLNSSFSSEFKNTRSNRNKRFPISLKQALELKGVVLYSAWALFLKLSGFTFICSVLSNLKLDVTRIEVNYHLVIIAHEAGVIVGTFIIGKLSDLYYSKRSPVIFIFIVLWEISWWLFVDIKNNLHIIWYYIISFIIGWFSESTFNTIASVVAVDISKQYYENSRHKAISTVSSIILCSGSYGNVLGLLLSNKFKFTGFI